MPKVHHKRAIRQRELLAGRRRDQAWPVRVHADSLDTLHCAHDDVEWLWSRRANRAGVLCRRCRHNVGVQLGWVRKPWFRWHELAFHGDELEQVA